MAMIDRGVRLTTSLYPVKIIDDVTLNPTPAMADKTIVQLKQALHDRESYSGLVLLNVPETSNRATKRLIGQLAGGKLYSTKIKEDDARWSAANRSVENVAKSLEDMEEGATLYVYWDAPILSDPDAAAGDVLERMGAMLKKRTRPMASPIASFTADVQSKRPDIKVVVAVPAVEVADKDLNFVEVMALDKIPYEFGAVSYGMRVDKYVGRALPGVDRQQAANALRAVDTSVLKNVVRHAQVLVDRQRTDDPYAAVDELATLQASVKLFERRSHGPDTSEEASDTSYARKFLVADNVLKNFRLDTHVAGVDGDIKSFAKMLRNYETYKKFLPEANKNLLLEGPVGTGKTTIARALAAELGFPLFAPKSSELIDSYIGKSAANVYRLFKQVREYARQKDTTAVLFIDEADAVLSRRGGKENAEREYARVVNAFLESLEGLDEDACNRLVVVLSTNLAEHLDPGIASRFGSKIEVPLPDAKTLQAIYRIHLRGRVHTLSHTDLIKLASLSHKFSGRDVVNVLRAADRTVFARMAEGADAPPPIDYALLSELIRAEVDRRATGMEAPPPEGMYT